MTLRSIAPWLTFPLWLLAMPVGAAVPPTAPDPQVLEVRELAWRAWFGGDETTLRRLLPEDFVGFDMAAPQSVDRETAIAQAVAFARGGGRLVALDFPETRQQRYGDVVIFYGRFRVVFTPAAGAPERTVEGRLTEMFLAQGDTWVHTGWHLDTIAP